MPINPAIAMGTRGIELADPLAQYGRVAAIQSAQQQNQLAQLQMQQAQREQESTNALNRAYAEALNPQSGEVDINKLRQSLSTGGFGSKLPGIEKQLGEVATQRLQQKKLQGEIASQEAGLIDAKLKQARSFLDTIDPADPTAPEKYIAWQQANYNDPVLGPVLKNRGVSETEFRSQVAQAVQRGPQAFAELLNRSKLGTEKFIELNKPVITQQTLGGEVRAIATPGLGGAATVVPGSTAQVTMTPAQIEEDKRARERIRQEGQRLGLEGRRVAVLEANARRDSDPVFQQQMEAARTTGRKIAEGDVAAQQALPKIISRAQESLRLIDEMVGKPEVRDASGKVIQAATKPHPGFGPAVGMGGLGTLGIPGVAQYVPGTDAADFKSRFDQAKGSSFLEAFESIKGAGAITEKEGAKATDAINRMSLSQSEKEFMAAARDLQDVIRKGVENAQRKAGGAAARGAPGGGGGVDTNNPLLK